MPPIKYLGFKQVGGANEFHIIPTAIGQLQVWRKSADGTRTLIDEKGQLVALLLAFVTGGVESNVSPEMRERAQKMFQALMETQKANE